MRPSLLSLLVAATFWGPDLAFAQSTFPPQPVSLREFFSKKWPGATISYKQVSNNVNVIFVQRDGQHQRAAR